MKTINCTLPIYDKIEKQAFERGKHGGNDKLVPVICPRHRLPSFQWNAEADNMGTITDIQLCNSEYTGANKISSLSNGAYLTGANPYDTFTTSGTAITSAIKNTAGGKRGHTLPIVDITKDDIITVEFDLTLNSGQLPVLTIMVVSPVSLIYTAATIAGHNHITVKYDSNLYSVLGNDIQVYLNFGNTADTNFSTTAISVKKQNITNLFTTLPAAYVIGSDSYYSYNGDALELLLPYGEFYLKITTSNGFTLYSDWFEVTCIYKNLITGFVNVTYEQFVLYATTITTAEETGAAGRGDSTSFVLAGGESVNIIFFLTKTSGQLPTVKLYNQDTAAIRDSETAVEGLNNIELTATTGGNHIIYFENTAAALWITSEVIVIRKYSETYLRIDFSNTCDLGDIVYQDGFTQSLWLESEPMEISFPIEEEGVKNGDSQVIRAFARQVKKYTAKTKEIPDFIVEVLHRMRLHDTISLIDLVGDENDVYNLEVDHDWMDDDRYYAKAVLTFDYDEAFVIGGCCNNLT